MLLDWSRVQELRDEVGAEDFAEVVELFLEEVTEALARVAPGSPGLSEDLHFLKGAALNLGFAEFAGLCRDGEITPDIIDAEAAERLRTCYEESKIQFLDKAHETGFLAA